MLFPEDLFLALTFPKLVKKSIFLLNFHKNFHKFPKNLFFFQASEKLAKGL